MSSITPFLTSTRPSLPKATLPFTSADFNHINRGHLLRHTQKKNPTPEPQKTSMNEGFIPGLSFSDGISFSEPNKLEYKLQRSVYDCFSNDMFEALLIQIYRRDSHTTIFWFTNDAHVAHFAAR